MNNKSILLLKTLLLSTSQRNIFKYSSDRKKRRRVIGSAIGVTILYAFVMVFCIAMCIGFGKLDMIGSVPVMCALLISVIAFVFTVFKTNGYLFHFKEYDMLMSLPFETRTVAGCKFLYMYCKSLPWFLSISVSMMIGYGYFARPFVMVYPLWIILSLILPLIPMLAAAFIGFLVARIGSGFRKTNLIQTVLTFVFVILCFSLRFILEDLFRNNKVETTLESASQVTSQAAGIYLPARWFADAVTKWDVLSILLLAGLSILLFTVVFLIVGRSYRNINSALKSHAAAKNYRMKPQKKRKVVWSIAFKEYKRMTGSTTYMVNGAIGVILAPILAVVMLVIGFENILRFIIHDAPISVYMLQPAIPFIVYFFIGMMATTACSPSLEGKNYWILQSLPLEKKTIYQGKMLFNMILTVPSMVVSTLCMSISAGVSLIDTVLFLILGVVLCAFSTCWGCVCGIRHMRLDWENEVEVIKQGAAVTIYLLPNMFVVMGLIVLMVFLGTRMNHSLLTVIMILVAAVLAAASWMRVRSLTKG